MQRLDSAQNDFDTRLHAALSARDGAGQDVQQVVRDIILAVRRNGDAAVQDYTRRFDHHDAVALRLSADTISTQASKCPLPVYEALKLAATRVRAFHEKQTLPTVDHTDALGVRTGLTWSPMDSVGLYVPGGRASYPSSVLMNAIPAQVAGVKRLVLCVPMPEGQLNPAVLAAASLLGIDEMYGIGGAQAVAAMAYGTATIKAVDKIVGPGNAYVAEAKRQVFGKVGIDSIAGPSEVLIIADDSASPQWLAWDLMAQAEHDPEAQSILITASPALATAVTVEVEKVLETLPTVAVARQSWQNHGLVIVVENLRQEAPTLINRIAPEHLQLCVRDAFAWSKDIRHAGSVFVGHHTPEALGDYLAGPNHILPTMGTARFASGLSVYDFVKRTTWLYCPESALPELGGAAAILADSEGLPAHAGSLRARLGVHG